MLIFYFNTADSFLGSDGNPHSTVNISPPEEAETRILPLAIANCPDYCSHNEEDLSIARSRAFKCLSHFFTTLTGRDWMSANNLQRIPGL